MDRPNHIPPGSDAPRSVHPDMRPVADAAKDVTARAALKRIQRKAEIMRLDAQRGSVARQDAEEIALLAGIGLRCLGDG